MSVISQNSNVGTLPSTSNGSTRDYGDIDGFDIMYPHEEPLEYEEITSSNISMNPSKQSLLNKISKMLGDNTEEYSNFITDLFYNWKMFNRRYPAKYEDIIKYIDRRIN